MRPQHLLYPPMSGIYSPLEVLMFRTFLAHFYLLFGGGSRDTKYNKEICHLTAEKNLDLYVSPASFTYKSGQGSYDFLTVAWVHKPSSCPTDDIFCLSYRFLGGRGYFEFLPMVPSGL